MIEDIQRVSLVNETMSESNAHINTDHLTTNLSQSSGFGDGPQKRRMTEFVPRSPRGQNLAEKVGDSNDAKASPSQQ